MNKRITLGRNSLNDCCGLEIFMNCSYKYGVALYKHGMDTNAHHVVWGSTDTKGRGESLLNY